MAPKKKKASTRAPPPRRGTPAARRGGARGATPRMTRVPEEEHACLAATLHSLNMVFMFFAVCMIGGAIYALVNYQFGSELFSFPLPYALLAFGITVFAINICGCQGVEKRKRKCLFAYFVFMLLLVLMEVCVVILTIYYYANIQEVMYQAWIDSSDEVKNEVQQKFNCCGYFSAIDHYGSNCEGQPRDTKSCSDSISKSIQTQLQIVLIAVSIAAFAQLFGVVAAVMLIQKVDEMKAGLSDSSYYSYSDFDAI